MNAPDPTPAPKPKRIVSQAFRDAMREIGRKGGLVRSLKKTDAVRRNAHLPPKPGSLPRGEWGRRAAREKMAALEAAGLMTAADIQKRNPRISCSKSCGFDFIASSEMLAQVDKGKLVKWNCPQCGNVNELKHRRLSARSQGYVRKVPSKRGGCADKSYPTQATPAK